jgi:hypothetical protein
MPSLAGYFPFCRIAFPGSELPMAAVAISWSVIARRRPALTDRAGKLWIAGILLVLALVGLAYKSPSYFTNLKYLGTILFIEVIAAAIWMYRRAYFPLVLVTFLFAGMDLSLGSVWNVGRWVALGVGAFVGLSIVIKDRCAPFRLFHLLSLFAVLAAVVSACASRYSSVALLKTLSLGLLFLYAAAGARLAVLGRENEFFSGLVNGSEIFVALIASSYLFGFEVMGNPNSLGAVMGVVAAPLLLWGILVSETRAIQLRRTTLFIACVSLILFSHARASMAAALVSCGVMSLSLRRYRLLIQGAALVAIIASLTAVIYPETYSNAVPTLTNEVLFKGKDSSAGILSSRQSVWQQSLDSIKQHFWFGSGLGVSGKENAANDRLDRFSSTSSITTEHGSSYLAIIDWVGVLGILPFFALLSVTTRRVIQTVIWMASTRNVLHPSVPIAMVIVAGMVHAGFEDWMFAPGYYLTVFFWSLAFVMEDYIPVMVNGWRHRAFSCAQAGQRRVVGGAPPASAYLR